MAERKGKIKIQQLQKQWKGQGLLYCLLISLSASIVLVAVLHSWYPKVLLYGVFIEILLFGTALWLFPYWRITTIDTARYLSYVLRDMEESCELLLKPEPELGMLEKWQAMRTEDRLLNVRVPVPLQRRLLSGVVFLLCSAALGGLLWRHSSRAAMPVACAVSAGTVQPAEKPVAGIRSVELRIVAPAYTGKEVSIQHEFGLQAPEGSVLGWQLETTTTVHQLRFIFNDSSKVSLKAVNPAHTLWRWEELASRSGFYQVEIDGRLSDLYKMEVLPDEAPRIRIRTPKPYVVVDFGEPKLIPLSAQLEDDYGLSDADIVATIASGSGEAVKFREQVLRFDQVFSGMQRSCALEKKLDLNALGMKPGDELYFYLRAKDNHAQQSRSDMYIISLPDTAQLMSLEGMTTGVDVKPEYFRSERQIIIETEQLLREKDTIAAESFKQRSNDLGIDQKLLRLRYGKFLGEEAEEGDAGGQGKDVGGPGDFGNAAKILDAFTDKHDNAEDASFFEPAIKEQLKATLTEMWGAELRLRVFQPQEALPYEYKALRLLKDLQQKSRVYVAKTSARITPLNPTKRLTGELKDIEQPSERSAGNTQPSAEDLLRIALGLLEEVKEEKGTMQPVSVVVLQQAERQLGSAASAHPAQYLEGYRAIRKIHAGEYTDGDILSVQSAIRNLLPEVEARPVAGKRPVDAGLSQLYFRNLNPTAGKK